MVTNETNKAGTVSTRPSPPPKRTPSSGKQKNSTEKRNTRRTSVASDTRGLGKIVVRNEFYKAGFHMTLRIIILHSIVIAGMIGSMFFVAHVHQPKNRYFPTTGDGRLIPIPPLNVPSISNAALMSWVAQTTTSTMTFSFSDYRRRLQKASANFTRRGWESFKKALYKARIFESIEVNKQTITAATTGAPILQSHGVIGGRYQWVVQIPIELSFQSGPKIRKDKWLVNLVVVRVSRLENPSGVSIAQWVAATPESN